jgi:predicted GNAT family N-acyltransferase
MRLHEVLATPQLIVKSPGQCTADEIDLFCSFVGSAGTVNSSGLRSRVRQAKVLVFLEVDSEIVGVTAIKQPNASYRADVFAKAGVDDPEQYAAELGWLVIIPTARGQGYSEKLIRAALEQVSGGVFATSAADNAAVHRINLKVGLKPAGKPYKSALDGRAIVLFLRG